MAITTLVEFWQQEVTVYTAAKAAAQAALAAAQTGNATARKQRDTKVDALKTNTTAIAAKRAKLATSKIPSETDALTLEIRDLIEQQRSLQGTILDDQDRGDWWQAQLDVAGATLTPLPGRLDDPTAQLADAQQAAIVASTIKVALAQPPFDTMKGDATGLLGGQVAADAKTQLKGTDFPSPLFDRAEKRHQMRSLHITSLVNSTTLAQNGLGTTAAADMGLDGAAENARVAFALAHATAR